MNKSVLSIMMLVSDRQEIAMRAINSLLPIRSKIKCELILVDTGCSKDLRAFLEEQGDKVLDFDWCNDFAKARNFGLKAATGEWFLYMDDDEFFEDSDEIVTFFTSNVYKHFGFASYAVRNYLDMQGHSFSDFHANRMSRITEDLHFEGRIHEYLTGKEGEGIRLHSIVGHYGYVFGNDEARRKHFERNVSILREVIEEEPDRIHWGTQLIQEYRSIEDYEGMISCAKEYLPKTIKQNKKSAMGTMYVGLVWGLRGLTRYEEACQYAIRAIAIDDLPEMAKAILYESLAYAQFELGNFREAYAAIDQYMEILSIKRQNDNAFANNMGDIFISEAFDNRRVEEAYSLLICCDLLNGSTEKLKNHFEELHWNEVDSIYIYEHMAEVLLLAMNEIDDVIFIHVAKTVWGISILRNYFISQLDELRRTEDMSKVISVLQIAEDMRKK